MTERIPTRFANNGDRTAIELTDAQGKVSWDSGYGNDYERRIGEDPNAKAVERTKQNWLFGVLTENAKQWQDQAFPEWRGTAAGTVGIPFAKNAFVRLMSTGEVYRSLQTVPANTPVTNAAYWEIVLNNSQITAISPMPAGGGVAAAELITSASGVDLNGAQFQSGTWEFVDVAASAANLPEAVAGTLECKAWRPVPATPSVQAKIQRYHTKAGKTWTRAYNGTSWSVWEQIQQRSELANRGYFGAPAVTDLNTMTETGFYAGIASATNLPPDITPSVSWNLIVTKRQTGGVLAHQMLFADNASSNSGAVWVRSMLGTTWRSWRRMAEVSDVPAPVNFPKFASINFDTVAEGSYYMTNASFGTSTGTKPSPSGAGVLTTVVNTPYAAQTYNDYQGCTFYRGRLNETNWTAWNQSANYAEIPAPKYFPVDTAINFDTISAAGTYYFNAASFTSSTGTKPQNTIGGRLISEVSGTFRFQTFNSVEGSIYIRGKNGGAAWTAWVDPSKVMGPGAMPEPILLSTQNLDTITAPGHYVQAANANASLARNYPIAAAGALMVYMADQMGQQQSGCVQSYFSYNSPRIWVRTTNTTVLPVTWTAWVQLYSSNNKPTPTELGVLAAGDYLPRRDSLNNSGGSVTTYQGNVNALGAGTYRLVERAASTNAPPGASPYYYVETKSIYATQALLQTAWPYDSGGEVWVRNYSQNASAWSAWVRLFSTLNPPTAKEVGAVSITGDTMTGLLNILNGSSGRMLSLTSAAGFPCYIYGARGTTPAWYLGNGSNSDDTQFTNYAYNTFLSLQTDRITINKPIVQGPAQSGLADSLTRKDYVDSAIAAGDALQVSKSGDTMTGNLIVPAVLMSAVQQTRGDSATRKDYVDSAIATGDALQVSKSGDTMTGNLFAPAVLVSSAQNASPNALARKDYVDAQVATRAPTTHTHTAAQGNADIVASGWGQVGSYAMACCIANVGAKSAGFVIAGSNLKLACGSDQWAGRGATLPGTWKLLGYIVGDGKEGGWNNSTWIRIS